MRTKQDRYQATINRNCYKQMRYFHQPGDFFLVQRLTWQNSMKIDEQTKMLNHLGDEIKRRRDYTCNHGLSRSWVVKVR